MKFIKLRQKDKDLFIKYAQEAFQLGYEKVYGKSEEIVLPEKDLIDSLKKENCHAFEIVDDEIIGGAIVEINEKTNHNHLNFLFVKADVQIVD